MGNDDHQGQSRGSAASPSSAAAGAVESVDEAVDDAKDSKVVHVVARSGFVATGLIHVLIGAISLRIVLGEPGRADQSGAVAQMAATPAGGFLLWAGLATCTALALYMASEAVLGWQGRKGSKRGKKRLKAAGLAVVFGAAAATFGNFALGRPTDSSQESRNISADLMSSALGTVLLVIIGLALIVAGGTYAFLGVTRRYEKALRGKPSGLPGDAFTVLGVFGYCAKGVALGAVGLLVIVATARHDPSQSGGLDSALKAFLEQPFGAWVLAGVGLGLIGYGIFSVFRSRYQRL